ncbi:hypothetical protein AB0F91_06155 [Amycolatopsis sp. NPDC023774]|uniref:hypothetical protein n=1 Tax=Amycolatopsis sp. NPDC023774 TaxID=3155015 RepID=UPI0033E7596F
MFLTAFVSANGTSVLDNAPPAYQGLFPVLAAQSSDDTVMVPFEVWRDAFIGDADLARAVPRSCVLCGEDSALPPGDPGHGYLAKARRLGTFRLVTLEGPHEVMFTDPARPASKLALAGRD